MKCYLTRRFVHILLRTVMISRSSHTGVDVLRASQETRLSFSHCSIQTQGWSSLILTIGLCGEVGLTLGAALFQSPRKERNKVVSKPPMRHAVTETCWRGHLGQGHQGQKKVHSVKVTFHHAQGLMSTCAPVLCIQETRYICALVSGVVVWEDRQQKGSLGKDRIASVGSGL